MVYIIEIIKGICFAAGFVIAMLITIGMLIRYMAKSEKYEADDLIEPFQNYLGKVKIEEHYEQISEVERIIDQLNQGILPTQLTGYQIKSDNALHLSDENGSNVFRVVKKYVVVAKRPTPAQ